MSRSRRADAVIFGFDFQVNAAIVLMIENIRDLESLRLEGNYEDIELKLNGGSYILAQAKAIEKSSSDFSHVRENLKKALTTLSEASHNTLVEKLILLLIPPIRSMTRIPEVFFMAMPTALSILCLIHQKVLYQDTLPNYHNP